MQMMFLDLAKNVIQTATPATELLIKIVQVVLLNGFWKIMNVWMTVEKVSMEILLIIVAKNVLKVVQPVQILSTVQNAPIHHPIFISTKIRSVCIIVQLDIFYGPTTFVVLALEEAHA
jgi:hypothetical protein